MAFWDPWRGCHRHSDGCKYCYIHKGDLKRGRDTDRIELTAQFDAPVRRDKKGEYKMKPGQTVYLCFRSDFLLEDADPWRAQCWDMIRERKDLTFLFLTKRIERFAACAPADWGDGYENVVVGCTIENRRTADFRLGIFDQLPIRHKNVICQPLLEEIDLTGHLKGVELVVVGGESDANARPLDYDWVLKIREQCVEAGTAFSFRQCGTNFIRDGQTYRLQLRDLGRQARAAGIDYTPEERTHGE